MRSRSIHLLLAAACVLSGNASFAQEPSAKKSAQIGGVDRNGDALNGAMARFGTQRWRHGEAVTFLAYLPDGKRVLTAAQDGMMQLWDRESGRPLHPFKVPVAKPNPTNPAVGQAMVFVGRGGGQSGIAVSPDGKILAAGLFNAVQLWDVDTGKELRQIKMTTANGINSLLFSPDGKMLAVRGFDRNIALMDVASGNEIRKITVAANNNARVFVAGQGVTETVGMAFAPDGKTIATGEAEFKQQKAVGFIRITSVESSEQARRIDTPAGTSALVYSPDGKILAQAGANAIHLRDAESGNEIRKLNVPNGAVALVFSKDGKVLASKGRDNVVRLWNADKGDMLHQLGEAPVQPAGNAGFVRFAYYGTPLDLALSPDGKDIALGGGKSPRFWDIATGKEHQALGGHRGTVLAAALSADGNTLMSFALDNTVRRWDCATGKELRQFTAPANTNSAAFAGDGETVAFAITDATIRLCDVVTGKERAKLTGHANGTAALLFSPDGKTLVSRGSFDGIIRIHDAVRGSELRQIALFGDAANGGRMMFGGYGGAGMGMAFSADGKTLAGVVGNFNNVMIRGGGMPAAQGPSNTIRLWDIAAGKELRKMDLPSQRGTGSIAFSPDGRLLAMENADQTFSLWEIASGKERATFGEPGGIGPVGMQANGAMIVGGGFSNYYGGLQAGKTLSFSPDGQLLATKGPDHSISVWQVANAKELADFSRHNAAVSMLTFAPDGKRIASGSADTTLLTWNVANIACEPAGIVSKLTAEDALSFWNDLAGDNAAKAYKAIRTLAGDAKQSMPLFQKNLQAAKAIDAKLLDQLLADLESEKFATRSKAKEELEKLGELAVPALQKRLESDPPLETRRRIEPLLAKQLGGVLTSEQLRLVRALESLELLGTSEARALLNTLANGAPGALSARHAQVILDRLGKRTP